MTNSEPEYIEAKSILTKYKNSPDPWFGITYNMNLYRGCQHGCIYCDSRSDVYGLEDLSRIRVKENALSLLEIALKKRIKKGTVGTGSMNDPYMPIEKHEELTRGALKIISKYRFPVHVLTKNNLITRDADIIKSISEIYAAASFTITTPNDELSKTIEPKAPPSTERLNALKTLRKKGIYAGVLIMPLLPYITDKTEDLKTLIKMCADNGANYILVIPGMTLRKGQREYYYEQLDFHFPDLSLKYKKQFYNQYDCASPNQKNLWETYKKLCADLKIETKMKFFKEKLPQQQKLF